MTTARSDERTGPGTAGDPSPGHEPGPRIREVAERELAAAVDGLLNRHAAVGFAVGIVRDGHLEGFAGRGFADVTTRTPITEDTVFRIASISKTVTAIAVMQLSEAGLVDLDAPANDFLRAYRLVPVRADFRPPTLRHLLTHTAGIGEVIRPSDLLRPDWGDSIPLGAPMPTLAHFYRGAIPVDIEPGTTFTYTNHGLATAAQIVEDVSGVPFDRYLRERIFEPLGMVDTDIVRSDRLASRLAKAYALGPTGPRPVADREWVTAGASSIYSTIRDMSRYAAALMGGGRNEHGSILRPDTLAAMFAPHFQPDRRMPGMGLGFDRNPSGGHLVVGHGGILPGINSQLFVAPEDGLGVIAFTTGARLAMLWLPTELGRLLNAELGVPEAAIRTDLPQRPELWPELCGWYRSPGRLLDVRARLMTGAGAQVFARGDRLALRLLTPVPGLLAGLPLWPDDADDPDAFRVDLGAFGLPTARIVFGREEEGGVSAMHTDIFPVSLRRSAPPTGAWSGLARSVVTAAAVTSVVAAVRRRRERRRRRRAAGPAPA
ncbi:MAG TPA: serine hydrolase domain-containing protein [Candidatus Limnocylindrales bacterium]|nr:serine hydrolase domain-containing protein [Candidatus Limnocylindrales bacterium]